MNCRSLRLKLVAGFSIALAMPALAMAAETPRSLATQTTLTAETRDQGGRTRTTVTVNVNGEDGLPATGAVTISDHGEQLAGAALNAEGKASIELTLPAGDHVLSAAYAGDAAHKASVSLVTTAQGATTPVPNFSVSVSPASLSLTAGDSGTITASITPENSSALTAPMFVTLSCSGLPEQASCTFTPENLEIQPSATAAITSSMVIQTQKASASLKPYSQQANSVNWALLLPGALGLGGLAWGVRRRTWLNRLALLGLVALVTMLGTTACAPRYNYYNHGPPQNPATPSGTYTVTVTAQSSNGVSATTNFTTMALTVK